jgi:hypothetical protein
MDALQKQQRVDVFNNYPPSVMNAFSSRHKELPATSRDGLHVNLQMLNMH